MMMKRIPLIAMCLGMAACGLGAQDSSQVTISLPLTDAECSQIQNPNLGGSTMAGTFVAVAGAEFPPITSFHYGEHPCASRDGTDTGVADIKVDIPQGSKRVVALAVVGERLNLAGDYHIPQVDLEGFSLPLQDPRTVFFAGGATISLDDLQRGSIDLKVEPFINLFGEVQVAGAGGQAKLTFYRPAPLNIHDPTSGKVTTCVPQGDLPDLPGIEKIYSIDTTPLGKFYASVPYRATDDCINIPNVQGNEIFAVAETPTGEFAMIVPGRAQDPGSGLEPGIFLSDTFLFPRTPQATSGAMVTGAVRIPSPTGLVLAITVFGSVDLMTLSKISVDGVMTPVTLDLVGGPVGGSMGNFQIYDQFRTRLGQNQISMYQISTATTLGAGPHTIVLSGLPGMPQFTLR
jgi:hypothetical protein